MTNAVNWFEIPVKDFDRAKKIYSMVLGKEVEDASMPNMKYGVLPYNQGKKGVGGAIVESTEQQEPSKSGTLVYLNGGDDLSDSLSRVESAGGEVVMPKTSIGENGFMAHFIDTEGNKVALHSMS